MLLSLEQRQFLAIREEEYDGISLTHLCSMRICIADLNIDRANQTLSELLNSTSKSDSWAFAVKVDVANWDAQEAGFQEAIDKFGRIDYVFPVAGVAEGRALPKQPKDAKGSFARPNFAVYNVCGTGMMYTIWLGVQHFRRQKLLNRDGFLGKSEYTKRCRDHSGAIVL